MDHRIRIDGKSYLLTTDDTYLDAVGNDFEPHMVELYKTFIKPGDVVVDIGGNIGLTSILFSNLAGKVYSFEPSPSTFQIMKENLARAKTGNTNLFNLGMGDKEDVSTITFAKNNRSGAFVSNKIQPKQDHITEHIKIVTLDSFFKDVKEPIDFIKIDVEGFETCVIKGGMALLQKFRPVVTLELNVFCLDVLHRITIPEYFDFLRSVFPRLYAVDTGNSPIADLHDEREAYHVMHEHIVNHRFLNLIGGFDDLFVGRLNLLRTSSEKKIGLIKAMPLAKKFRFIKDSVKKKLGLTPAAASQALDGRIDDWRGHVVVENPPEAVGTGEAFILEVRIKNEGGSVWTGTGNQPVQLSYHWQTAEGETLVHDGERTCIGCDRIMPGEMVRSRMKVTAPMGTGSIRLVVTMVQEGVCWFEDHGFSPDILEFSNEE